MGIIYEIGYFHELHKGKTSHYVGHLKELVGREYLDEGFRETSHRTIGTVIIESGKNKMKYTFHNLDGMEIFHKEYPIVRDQDFYDDTEEYIHEFLNSKEFYNDFLPRFLDL